MDNVVNVASRLEASARAYPSRTALILGETRLSYAQLNGAANRVAGLLRSRGIGRGDLVAISIPNLPYFPIVYFGILKAGATVVPLNVMLTEREIAYHLEDSRAVAYFAFEGSAELPIGTAAIAAARASGAVRELFLIAADPNVPPAAEGVEDFGSAVAALPTEFDAAAVHADDVAVVLYTSGTTGRPKGAELTHGNVDSNIVASMEVLQSDPDRADVYLGVLPLFHAFGQTVVQNTAIATGGTIVLLPRFEPAAALDLIVKERITFLAGVPTIYWALLRRLEAAPELASTIAGTLRIAVSGGSALPAAIHAEFQQRFGITILEGYGLSETSPVVSFSRAGAGVRVGSIGTPLNGVEMRLIGDGGEEISAELGEDGKTTVGEIAVRGPNVMRGYLHRPDATAEVIKDGWFRTGDLARRDADGWYYIVDRAKDLIIRSGYNVYPREIEEELMAHPAVSIAAVIGVPDTSHGQEIKAVVVKKPDDPTTEDELIAWGRERFAAYKYPRIVEFRDALPLTGSGKVLKRELV